MGPSDLTPLTSGVLDGSLCSSDSRLFPSGRSPQTVAIYDAPRQQLDQITLSVIQVTFTSAGLRYKCTCPLRMRNAYWPEPILTAPAFRRGFSFSMSGELTRCAGGLRAAAKLRPFHSPRIRRSEPAAGHQRENTGPIRAASGAGIPSTGAARTARPLALGPLVLSRRLPAYQGFIGSVHPDRAELIALKRGSGLLAFQAARVMLAPSHRPDDTGARAAPDAWRLCRGRFPVCAIIPSNCGHSSTAR